jgi:hypothetical protein
VRSTRRLAAVALLLGLGGCRASWPGDLGALPADQARVSESEDLAWLEPALEAQDGLTVAELVRGRKVRWVAPPDPQPRFEAAVQAHQALPPLDDPVRLEILTYNVALLDRPYAGTRVTSPYIAERRPWLLDHVFETGADIVLLQEVWEWEDAEAFGAAAEARGFAWTAGTPERHGEHGLFLAVRADRIAEGTVPTATETRFEAQRTLEWWPGPGVRRGWLAFTFELASTDRTIHVLDVHATSFPRFARVRDLQARQVGLALEALPDPDIVLLGGDLNAGPYYDRDTWTLPGGRAIDGWWRNALAWGLWQHYGDLTDLVMLAGMADDVEVGRTVPDLVDADPSIPFGDEGYCQDHLPHRVTGTDCNHLYFLQYGGTEFPARLDHLMLRDRAGAVRVREAGLVFTDRLDLGADEPIEPSDHYGVRAVLDIAR